MTSKVAYDGSRISASIASALNMSRVTHAAYMIANKQKLYLVADIVDHELKIGGDPLILQHTCSVPGRAILAMPVDLTSTN